MVLAAFHIVPSAPGVRDRLIGTLGRPVFYALHGTISAAVVIWIIRIYPTTGSDWLWSPPVWHRSVAVFAMPVALWLVAARLIERPAGPPRGIYRVAVAPGSAGVAIWAGLHLLNVGHTKAIVLFAAFAAIALVSLVKNWLIAPPGRRAVGPVPFLAIVARRQPVSVTDFRIAPVIAALAAWAALLMLHGRLIGADPTIGVLR